MAARKRHNRRCARERGHAVIFRQADGDADGEEERQIAEDGVARFRHDLRNDLGQPRKVSAADAEQDAGNRKDRDRQHHALADLLEEREGVLEVEHGGSVFWFRERAARTSSTVAQLERALGEFATGR